MRSGEENGGHLHHALLDSVLDTAIVAMDEAGVVVEWSEGAHRILGWTRSEVLGRSAELFFTPQDRAEGRLRIELDTAARDGRAADERLHLHRNGTSFWAQGEVRPLPRANDGRPGFVKILRDRSEHRERLERTRQDAEFLRSVLASSGDCIKVLDLDANLVFMSEGGMRVMEVSDFNAIRGCPWPDFWSGPGHEEARAAVAAARAGGIGRFRGGAPTMAGTSKAWDVQVTPILGPDGRPERLLSVSRDITATERAEAAVRASEAHWRGLFTRLQEGFILGELVRDAHGRVTDWRYLDVNPAWGRLVGVPAASATGQTIRELFPGIQQIWIDEVVEVVETGRSAQFLRQLGHIGRWYEGRAFHLQDDRFGVLFVEVTEREAAQQRRSALLEFDARLHDLDDPAEMAFAGAEIIGRTLGVERVGYGTMERDDSIIVIDRDWAAPDQASVAGRHDMRLFGTYLSDLREGRSTVVQDTKADPRLVAHEFDSLGIRAMVNLPLLEQGRLVALLFAHSASPRAWTEAELGFMRDVADRTRSVVQRRRAEHALRDLAASLELQVEARTRERDRVWNATNDLMGTAGLDGYLKHINPAWARGLGWSEAELLSRPFVDLVDPADHEATAEIMRRLAAGEPVSDFVDHVLQKDGSWRTISWNAVPDGDVFHVVGRDLTAQHAIEDQLRQSQKMEAVGQLTGGLAHDFNNLLTGVTGSLELLQTRIAQGRIKDVDRYVNAAQGAARRAAALTHRLLAFSRRQTLDPRPTDLNRLILGMEELIRRTVGPNVTVEPMVAAMGLWPTQVDPGQLENALLNLCINARDAMPQGGKITIETGNRWLDQRAAAQRDLPPGQYVSMCVSDTGIGMTPDVIVRAFEPFFTTKPIGQGTGLGLSMIYGFAKQSGGQVRIYSELGQGTMVCLYLPRHLGSAEDAETMPDLADAPRASDGQTVLVVDDEPTVRMLVTEVLEDLGYTAIEAADGAAGLKVLQSDVQIDLLVTDVGLPGGMNGRQVADAARVTRPELKVMFITGFAENAVLSHGHLDPGMHVLTKPFAMEALASRIRELIGSDP